MPAGYYRFPTIHDETVVFVCEDDLWTISTDGGVPRRLTAGLGEATRPWLSRDGTQLSFVGAEEGQLEIYVMPTSGGPTRRLTYMGGTLCQTAGWTRDGRILFANNAAQPFPALLHLYSVDIDGDNIANLNVGPARAVDFGPHGEVVIGRNTADPARWKRYRGGTAGQIWIDAKGEGDFRPLVRLEANLANPMWIGGRIFFLSDHEGVGNVYSCLASGEDLRRHTDHEDFYARNPSTDGRRIVYHAGADLYLFDPGLDAGRKLPIDWHSSQTQRNRKFVEPAKYLEDAALSPDGQRLAIATRGKVFTMANWEGAVAQYGQGEGSRYRHPTWLSDGTRLVAITDVNGEEEMAVLGSNVSGADQLLERLDIGRPFAVAANPRKDVVAFSNHRYELMVLDLQSKNLRVIDRGHARPIFGLTWSPDGEWLAYSVSASPQTDVLRIWNAESGEVSPLTNPVLRDVVPAFDPQGKYLYFISYRHFDPVPDNFHFDLGFPSGMRPYLITLQKETLSPFILRPDAGGNQSAEQTNQSDAKTESRPVLIDLDGIQSRVLAFPVQDGLYGRVLGTHDGKVIYSRFPVEGSLEQSWMPTNDLPAKGELLIYDLSIGKEESLVSGVSDFHLSMDGCVLLYRAGTRLRVLKTGEKPDKEAGSSPGRRGGWINLDRIKVQVVPGQEWRQMFREAWRLQRDQFWTPDMSRLDWVAIHDRYLPLVDRVASRSEFSDLMWEMQGELGTSHAYEMGGDYRPKPDYAQGFLGADLVYDVGLDLWRIARILRGDSWDPRSDSPLNAPGIQIKAGDAIIAVNGRRVHRAVSPQRCLVNLAGEEVTLTIQRDGEPRIVTVRTLKSEMPVRYREWVESNRCRVHQATGGRVGYIHIPDMSARGYAEFHRGYLAEVDREGLVIDLRFNGGGNVSPLLLEKLARRRVGYDISRWNQSPIPYPPESVLGPMVALTNEFAGSDGDIFSHGFKMLKLGPLLGKRTWGGVVGIEPRQTLADGTLTTQPEFSFWFADVGWGVENYGTDPDIEVDNRPQDYARGVDAQLERVIDEIKTMLEQNPPTVPSFPAHPSRAVPKLPNR